MFIASLRRSVPRTFVKPSFVAVSMRHKSMTDSVKDTVKGAANLNPNDVSPTTTGNTINAPETTTSSSQTGNAAGVGNAQSAPDGFEDQTKEDVTNPEGQAQNNSKVVGKNMPGQEQELPGQGEIESERAMRQGGTPPNADQILK